MSELERLGINPEPLSSINGAQMTRPEFEVYRREADPSDFINDLVKSETYQAMDDEERALTLNLTIDQFQDDADSKVMNTENEFFRDLRQRVREKEAEQLEALGG